jgi:hypothetical protein
VKMSSLAGVAAAGARAGAAAAVAAERVALAGIGGVRSIEGRATAAVPMVVPATMSRMDLVMACAPSPQKRRIVTSGTDQGC